MQMMIMITKQVITMMILSLAGFLMFRNEKITDEGAKTLGNILIYLSLPCTIINSFLVENTSQRVQGLLISTILSAALLLLAMLISRLVLGRHALDNFAGSFSNPGFFGIPLVLATLGDSPVFYMAPFIAFLNMFQWTYGVGLLEKSDENDIIQKGKKNDFSLSSLLKKLMLAPFMVAIIIGLFFFLTGIRMPEIPSRCISFIAGLNTPIAMFTIGIYMARVDIRKMFAQGRLYLVSLVRIVIVPLVSALILSLLPSDLYELKFALLIASACPVGSNIAVYAQLHGRNYGYAAQTVVLSTMFSILTIPLIAGLSQILF